MSSPTHQRDEQGERAGASHTPGPWTNYANLEVRAPNNFTVAIITKPGLRNEITDANARLIAAAPDQHTAGIELDRLALVIESAVRNSDPSRSDAVIAALKANRAAIAKATGA